MRWSIKVLFPLKKGPPWDDLDSNRVWEVLLAEDRDRDKGSPEARAGLILLLAGIGQYPVHYEAQRGLGDSGRRERSSAELPV